MKVSLKAQTQAELHLAGVACGECLPKVGRSEDTVGWVVVDSIGEIEHFGPEFEPRSFRDGEAFVDTDI
jgi:hypothetical protein